VLVALLSFAVAPLTAGAHIRSAPHAPASPAVSSFLPDSSRVGSNIVATTDDDEATVQQTIPTRTLLAPDGTLRLEERFNGAAGLSGWLVTLDPERDPVFHPQETASPWEHLGTRAGALNNTVYAIAVSGSDVYVGGAFTGAGSVPHDDSIARWDGGQWHPVGGGVHKEVAAIAMSGTHVYVGGLFTDAGGNPHADHIARVMLITKGYLPLITR